MLKDEKVGASTKADFLEVGNTARVDGDALRPVAVYDIGGTWFRGGIFHHPRSLTHVFRQPSINFRDNPALDAQTLQEQLLDFLVDSVARFRNEVEPNLDTASVSLGAALNANTGEVYESGPLWGPECKSINILSRLAEKDPSTRWIIVNDVTAALVGCSLSLLKPDIRNVLLLTVSTGIAARLLNVETGQIPVDRDFGLQGEIGHLPVAVEFNGVPLRRRCDCGAFNHLNAYSSGRGLEGLLADVAQDYPDRWRASLLGSQVPIDPDTHKFSGAPAFLMKQFLTAIQKNDALAKQVLSTAVAPVADILRVALTLDPDIDQIVLTGGVAQNLGDTYLDTLAECFDNSGMYLITDRDPDFLRRRLSIAPADDALGMVGAGFLSSDHQLIQHSIRSS